MKDFWRPVAAVVWKDVLLETRTKDIVVSVLVFAILVIVIFNFAINPTPEIVAIVAPGVLWASIAFGGVLGFNRSFALEKEQGSLHALMLAPVSRDTIFFGKLIANVLFMLVVEAAVFPVFAVLFNLSMTQPGLIPIAVLATIGVAAVGTVFSAMAVNTRAREVMLPLLFFPVVLPAMVGAVEATGVVIGDKSYSDLARWLPLLAVFDAVFLVLCPIAFHVVVEE